MVKNTTRLVVGILEITGATGPVGIGTGTATGYKVVVVVDVTGVFTALPDSNPPRLTTAAPAATNRTPAPIPSHAHRLTAANVPDEFRSTNGAMPLWQPVVSSAGYH
jgi:hypothetical protein